MSSIIPSEVSATMTSREIAELTGKRHDNVMRDIEKQLAELLGKDGLLKFEDTYRNEQNGQEYRQYNLPKRECLIVVSGYSVELRARIIDRWQELEAAPPTFDLATMTGAALRELANKVEECASLKERVITMQPKADFYDHVANSDDMYDRDTAAKMLRTGPKRLWKSLREWRIVKESGVPYQKYCDAGYFRLVLKTIKKGNYEVPYSQVFITSRGLTWLKALMDSMVMPSHSLAKVA